MSATNSYRDALQHIWHLCRDALDTQSRDRMDWLSDFEDIHELATKALALPDGPKGEFHAPVELVCDAMNMARKHGAEKTNAEILKMMDPLGTWSTKAAICDLDGCYLMRHGATSGQVKEGK